MSPNLWMPLYVADYLLDTRELAIEQHGAYLMLLMLAWRRDDCRLPNDEKWLRANLPRMHGRTFELVVKPLLAKYFTLENGHFENERLSKEKRNADEKRAKAKLNISKRWAKTKENKELPDTPVILTQHNTTQHKESKKEIGSARKGSRLPENWAPSPADLAFAESRGLSGEERASQTEKFRDYWLARAGPGAVKLDWAAAWRNWVRRSLEYKQTNGAGNVESDRERRKRESEEALAHLRERVRLRASGDVGDPVVRLLPRPGIGGES